MGESAADVVAEIERIRGRLERDVDELRAKVPPQRMWQLGAVAGAGVLGLGWLVRRSPAGWLVPLAAGLTGGYVLAHRRNGHRAEAPGREPA
jgi:hypothetical protein